MTPAQERIREGAPERAKPRTRFRPELDGFEFTALPVPDGTDAAVRGAIADAGPAALGALQASYGAVLSVYGVPQYLAGWLNEASPTGFAMRRGMTFAALDYHVQRRLLVPRTARHVRLASESGSKRTGYAWSRAAEGLESSAAQLLRRLSILYLVPEQWLPSSWVTEPVTTVLRQHEQITNARVEIVLRPPEPGGDRWFRSDGVGQWRRLKAHLDAGDPWPIVLLDNTADPFDNRTVVAYDYRQLPDETVHVLVYDPTAPGRERGVAFRPDERPGALVEGVCGFYCEEYRARRPPSSWWARVFGIPPARRLLWSIVRWFRLRRLARERRWVVAPSLRSSTS